MPGHPYPIDRRSLLRTAAMTGGGLILPSCATTTTRGRPATAERGCLAPVDVAESRIIRNVVGLRPFRAAGFVVRGEPLGDKRLVHNYGHGGAGITLSWGTSKLAVDIGLPGHHGPVAIIGAGIVGLTTARLAQEAGFPVTLYAQALPPDTTSNIAGGQWMPHGLFRPGAVTPEWEQQFEAAAEFSWRRFQILVGTDYGIGWLPTYAPAGEPSPDFLRRMMAGRRALAPAEHPFGDQQIERYETLYVETGRFLRQLMRDIQLAGGRFVLRRFAAPAEIAALPERLVFNCTGLGARALFRDEALRPARGQLAILLPQPEVRYAYTLPAGYMFPRPDGIVLGGTFELDSWSTDPDPAITARILSGHRGLFAGFRCARAV